MNVKEAQKIAEDFSQKSAPSKDDEFIFTEAMQFLIEKKNRPWDMMFLGGFYYEKKKFDLALKYYEMAAALDFDEAYECLGYIWYYGRTGEKDYKKAFEYFSKMMAKGHLVATYKVADMYKNGYYVEKDLDKYREIIESLYPKVKDSRFLSAPLPEVFTRLARIRTEDGKIEEAIKLYLKAKDFQAQRLSHNAFFGDLNIMEWLIDDLYKIYPFDNDCFDFYDLYHLLKTPCKITFRYEDRTLHLEASAEGDSIAVCFEGKWFRDRREFFANAVLDGERLTSMYNEFYGFTLEG